MWERSGRRRGSCAVTRMSVRGLKVRPVWVAFAAREVSRRGGLKMAVPFVVSQTLDSPRFFREAPSLEDAVRFPGGPYRRRRAARRRIRRGPPTQVPPVADHDARPEPAG